MMMILFLHALNASNKKRLGEYGRISNFKQDTYSYAKLNSKR